MTSRQGGKKKFFSKNNSTISSFGYSLACMHSETQPGSSRFLLMDFCMPLGAP